MGAQREAARPELQIPLKVVLIAETQHPDRVFTLVERGELSGQILDVHTGPAVDMRRVSFVNTAIVISTRFGGPSVAPEAPTSSAGRAGHRCATNV